MTEVFQCSKVDLTAAQSCSMLAASAFPSPVAPLQRITMTTEALVSVCHKYIHTYVCIANVEYLGLSIARACFVASSHLNRYLNVSFCWKSLCMGSP